MAITLITIVVIIIGFMIYIIVTGLSNMQLSGSAELRNMPKITFADITGSTKYEVGNLYKRGFKDILVTTHIGQRKLFSNELEFLSSNYTDIVIYAGAAPCMHIWKLHLLFPCVKFILIDPNEFFIIKDEKVSHYDSPDGIMYLETGNDDKKYYKYKKSINYLKNMVDRDTVSNIAYTGDFTIINETSNTFIYLIENIFTIDLAIRLRDWLKTANTKYVFWSDIRTNLVDNEAPTELDIYWNSAQQMTWVDILKPDMIMLKFRCPYSNKFEDKIPVLSVDQNRYFEYCKEHYNIDFIQNYNDKKFSYIDGDLFIQPWAGQTSSETRLVCTYPFKIRDYNMYEYEDKFRYYNFTDRISKHSGYKTSKEHCIDKCGDCALEAYIWKQYNIYCKKIGIKEVNVLTEMIELKKYLSLYSRGLCVQLHGKLF